MGQKVNPIGLRTGINRNYSSRWFEGDKNKYGSKIIVDEKIRTLCEARFKHAGLADVIIERPTNDKVTVYLYTARPGVVIGKKGADIEKTKKDLSKLSGCDVSVNIVEVRKPDLDSKLVAESVARQLEKRVAFRRAMKRAVQNVFRMANSFGDERNIGIKIACSGRLGGAEIARTEWYREGRVPLHTLRADIGYSTAEALTTYGIIGIKVWIYTGDILAHDPTAREEKWYKSAKVS